MTKTNPASKQQGKKNGNTNVRQTPRKNVKMFQCMICKKMCHHRDVNIRRWSKDFVEVICLSDFGGHLAVDDMFLMCFLLRCVI